MSRKSEQRALKKARAQEKFEAQRARLIEKVVPESQPKQLAQVQQKDSPSLAPHLQRAAAETEKTPKKIKSGSRFGSPVTWCVSRSDQEDHWSWGEPREWTKEEWDSTINPHFKQFESLTWKEIDSFSSDSGHKMHHGHEIDDLIDEAQNRWLELGLEEFADSLFRFRFGCQKCRAWGFIVQAHFYFVWWEREHSLYPT